MSSGIRWQVESHLKPTGQRGERARVSRDILWKVIYSTAYYFSRLFQKLITTSQWDPQFPTHTVHNFTIYIYIFNILEYPKIPSLLSPSPSSLSFTHQAGHTSSATVYLPPMNMQIWYSSRNKRQWLTASVANVPEYKPYVLIADVSVLLRKQDYWGTTNINIAVTEVLIRFFKVRYHESFQYASYFGPEIMNLLRNPMPTLLRVFGSLCSGLP